MKLKIFEYLGAALGIVGALTLAVFPDMGALAYLVMLGSSVALTGVGAVMKLYGIAVMSGVYTIINVLGLLERLT